ncbi:13047_t:CDS:2, partial [Dentiscutata heterogama]
ATETLEQDLGSELNPNPNRQPIDRVGAPEMGRVENETLDKAGTSKASSNTRSETENLSASESLTETEEEPSGTNSEKSDDLHDMQNPSTKDVTFPIGAPVEEKEKMASETSSFNKATETMNVEFQEKDLNVSQEPTSAVHTQASSTSEISANSMDEDPKDIPVPTQETSDDGFTLVTNKKKDNRKRKSPIAAHDRQSPYKRPKRTEVRQVQC